MDNNVNPGSAPLAVPTPLPEPSYPPVLSSAFPSIGSLFTQAWQTFIKSMLSLFFLNILGIVIYIGLAVIAALIFILSGAGSSILKNGLQEIAVGLSTSPGSTIMIFIVIPVVFGLIYILVGTALSIASILLVDTSGQTSMWSAFKKSFSLIIPLFLVGISTFILNFGALFVFILPLIFFYFLLIFVPFEVVLNNQRWVGAIKRSVLIVSHHFGAILIRLILIALIYIAIAIIIPSLLNKIGPEVQIFVGIISFIINLLLGWYILSYIVTLYKQARVGLEQTPGKSILWMWVIAIIGWLIFAALIIWSWKLISSGLLNNLKSSLAPSLYNQAPNTPNELINNI